jgi:hypothetical protein
VDLKTKGLNAWRKFIYLKLYMTMVKRRIDLLGVAEWAHCSLADELEEFCSMGLVIFVCQKYSTVGTQYEHGTSRCEQVTSKERTVYEESKRMERAEWEHITRIEQAECEHS